MTTFCDRNNNTKKKKIEPIQKLYNPTNGQNGTSSGNNIGHRSTLVI